MQLDYPTNMTRRGVLAQWVFQPSLSLSDFSVRNWKDDDLVSFVYHHSPTANSVGNSVRHVSFSCQLLRIPHFSGSTQSTACRLTRRCKECFSGYATFQKGG